ncbi:MULTISPECIES: DUF4407 domain-containing protein [unclassified Micromonospora]|uniref:DUF4407 domain-containing protein n=1 Tax=unclassified Micromonospora TaxID=2617518 RepID=UPI0013042138|nr:MULTISPECIES: DUF4407 domain-containing protein [unclassified Micromonospora]
MPEQRERWGGEETERVSRRRGLEPPRLLRALAGVDESLLREVWHERARHTALGGVVLGTALIAGFSMLMAINQSLGAFSAVHLVPALLWAVFVLNLDRLLVTSMVGNARRVGSLVMRLAVALMFGFIIAEPLIMRIFETAIVQHIQDERGRQLDALRSNLVKCNGEDRATAEGDAVTPACQGFVLTFAVTPASTTRELAGLRGEAAALEKTVKRDTDTLARLRSNAVKECVGGGSARDGFSGRSGEGPLCRQRKADAEEFARTHPVAQNTAKLATLRERIAGLETRLGTAVATFEQSREEQINRRVEEERSHQGAIGFLERLDALHDLTGQSSALAVGTWAIRLFFVAIDCLPVVVKFFGGTSGYDELFKVRAGSSQRIFAERVDTEERRTIERYAAEKDEIERRTRMRRDEHDLSLQEHQVGLTARRGDAVSAYAAELLRGRREMPPEAGRTGANGRVMTDSGAF